MSEEIISPYNQLLLDTTKSELFQAQSTQFQIYPSLAKRCHESSADATPILLHGSKATKLIIGRGHDATIKIGKANKRVSREHATIEHKPLLNGFEMTILSPNGALIDHILFDQGEHVPVMEGTLIEIVGSKLVFKGVKEEGEQINIPITEEKLEQQQEKEPEVKTMAITTATTITTTVNSETHVKETSNIPSSSTISKFIKLTTSKIKKTARSIVAKRPMTLEDEIIQVLGSVLYRETKLYLV
jgi:hypothetical protein